MLERGSDARTAQKELISDRLTNSDGHTNIQAEKQINGIVRQIDGPTEALQIVGTQKNV